jgi:hypothetical protein
MPRDCEAIEFNIWSLHCGSRTAMIAVQSQPLIRPSQCNDGPWGCGHFLDSWPSVDSSSPDLADFVSKLFSDIPSHPG